MFIGIKEEKVFDITSKMVNKRVYDDGIPLTKTELDSVEYFEVNENMDILVDDSWIDGTNLKDSFRRLPREKVKSPMELKMEELENRIKELEKK